MIEFAKEYAQLIEIIAVVCGLAFVILIIYEKPIGWAFGIVQSALSVLLFYSGGLISESYVYLVYAILGVWGWATWGQRPKDQPLVVTNWKLPTWGIALGLGVVLSLALGWLQHNFNELAQRPYIDAFTSVFALIATVLEIRKKLPAWVLWIAVNAASIPLYWDREFMLYSLLMVVYFALSISGYLRWRKVYRKSLETAATPVAE